VLIEDRHHLCGTTEAKAVASQQKLLQNSRQRNWAVVVVTIQYGIARGYFSWSDYECATDRLLTLLGASDPVSGIDANGHGPNATAGSWRKPSPAMLLEASRELNFGLKKSILGGGRLSDQEAGTQAGVQTVIHVWTGLGYRGGDEVMAWGLHKQQACSQNRKHDVRFWNSVVATPLSLATLKT